MKKQSHIFPYSESAEFSAQNGIFYSQFYERVQKLVIHFSVSAQNRLITRLSPYLVYETPFWALSKLIPLGRFHIGVVLPGSDSCSRARKSSY